MKKLIRLFVITVCAVVQASQETTKPKLLDSVTSIKPLQKLILGYLGFEPTAQQPDNAVVIGDLLFEEGGTVIQYIPMNARIAHFTENILPTLSSAQIILLIKYSWHIKQSQKSSTAPSVDTIELIHPLKLNNQNGKFFELSPNGRFALYVDADFALNAETAIHDLKREIKPGRRSARQGNSTIAVDCQGNVAHYQYELSCQNMQTNNTIALADSADAPLAAQFSPDGLLLAAGYGYSHKNEHCVQIWDTSSGKLLHKLLGHTEPVKRLVISGNNQYLVSAEQSSVIKIWNLKTGALTDTINSNLENIVSLSLSPNGKYLAVSSAHGQVGTVNLWKNQAIEIEIENENLENNNK